jgi:pilus assembly protein CpaB
VADVGTMTSTPAAGRSAPDGEGPRRRVRRTRSLPGGRAVVGALLVTVAAVATFAAYLDATAEPTTSYLVAIEPVEPGTRFASGDDLREVFGSVTVELTAPLSDRAIPVEELDSLIGRVLVAPLGRGDLVTRTSMVDDGGVAPAQTMSFALPRNAAVGGTLRPGERIDVLATYGASDAAYTAYIVRGVPLLRVTGPDGGPLGTSSDVVLTVAVTELADVQALGHAISAASVFVTRSTALPGSDDAAPGAFRADPDAPGPLPDPATSTSPGHGADADVPSPDSQDPGTEASAEDADETEDRDQQDAG